MSHRRWRQNAAPGVSPGNLSPKSYQPSKRAARTSVAPPGLTDLINLSYPGLTPGAINLPPANAGSLNSSGLVSLSKRWLSLLGLGLFLFMSFGASSSKAQSSLFDSQEGFEMPVQERARVRAPELVGGRGWLNTDKPLSLAALKGKVVLLDFWTYGCINCMHIIPDLKKLERKYPNELVVIGVHSAKFENEKDTENIRRIVLRYEIEHPIVNDADFVIWKSYAVDAWPTRYLIDPAGYIIGKLSGEGGYEALDKAIADSIAEFRKRGELNEAPLKLVLERAKVGDLPLAFPGKILADQKSDRLFIADSDHNRIVVAKLDGTLIETIGTGVRGMAGGSFDTANFFRPQGMALDGDLLYVADTENHLVRLVDLKARTVQTIAGTGRQSMQHGASGPALSTALSSPWDLQLVGRTLYIAMAGPHQIWRLDLDKQQVSTFAGSGREGNADGSLSEATFAQPSGLALIHNTMYVADPEGSIIRAVDLSAGKVRTLAGGTRDLFDFGDRDGRGDHARLQHPLGLAVNGDKLLIADTYNHKIKELDTQSRAVQTFLGSGQPGQNDGPSATFYEPGGLAVAGDKLYVADTNNHAIRVVDLKTKETRTLPIKGLQPPAATQAVANDDAAPNAEEIKLAPQKVRTGEATIIINVDLPAGYHLNPTAPQHYKVAIENGAKSLTINEPDRSAKGSQFPIRVPVRAQAAGMAELHASFTFVYCREDNTGTCRIKTLVWRAPVEVVNDASAANEIKFVGRVGGD